MSRRDDTVSMRHMLDHARIAVQHGFGKTTDEVAADVLLRLALVRALEVIGEAASRVSNETRARYPAVPWRQTTALRNRLIHGYDTIDLNVVREIVHDDLPPLIARIEAILEQQDS